MEEVDGCEDGKLEDGGVGGERTMEVLVLGEGVEADETPLAAAAPPPPPGAEAAAAAAFFAAFLLDLVAAAAFFPAGPTSWKPSSSSC